MTQDTQSTIEHKPSQEERILDKLIQANGNWVSGRYFIQTMMISQAHARILSLQKKGNKIEASTFTDEYGFKAYRLAHEVTNQELF